MLMTAHELHELVKDVPKEAWPDVRYRAGTANTNFHAKWIHGDGRIGDDSATMFFEASMVRWLCRWGIDHSLVIDPEYLDNPGWAVLDGTNTPLGNGVTLIAALAAACKAVAKENAQ
jgi:hypothetical protein